ncbi:hypothetical protein O181_008997 [Austropuccinia psidii MF-1]|uniref:Polynucleotide 5'-hydroxyl-kinase GRC3 n=1 Tax=Austropuccinia psidii MF-1 TaxID=1389203 RepID=A0A9Q3BPX9_9BASI|nr:hypothetical protein [Austropuccinia psidii MF-1]
MACLLINPLLNTFDCVALLDLNPGQPLLTPPSLISLHLLDSLIIGPIFCKLISPYHLNSHSIYLGHITPIHCSSRYLDATNQLLILAYCFNPPIKILHLFIVEDIAGILINSIKHKYQIESLW